MILAKEAKNILFFEIEVLVNYLNQHIFRIIYGEKRGDKRKNS